MQLNWVYFCGATPDDATERVVKHSLRPQPSIILHSLVTALMFCCSIYHLEVRNEGSGQLLDNDRASWSNVPPRFVGTSSILSQINYTMAVFSIVPVQFIFDHCALRPSFCCTSDSENTEIRSYLGRHSWGTSLAPGASHDPVQDACFGAQMPGICTLILERHDLDRLEAFIRKSIRIGFCPDSVGSFQSMFQGSDEQFFKSIKKTILRRFWAIFYGINHITDMTCAIVNITTCFLTIQPVWLTVILLIGCYNIKT